MKIRLNNGLQVFLPLVIATYICKCLAKEDANLPPIQQADTNTKSHVIELTADDFVNIDAVTKQPKTTDFWPPRFILFYAPWCNTCQRVKPEWERLAKVVDDEKQSMKADNVKPSKKNARDTNLLGLEIAQIDCEQHEDICKDFAIMTYPTFLYFPAQREPIVNSTQRERVLYRGKRDLNSFTAYLDRILPYKTFAELSKSRYARLSVEHLHGDLALHERLQKKKFQNFLVMFYYDPKVSGLSDRLMLEYLLQEDVVELVAVRCPTDGKAGEVSHKNAVKYCDLYGPNADRYDQEHGFSLYWFRGPNMLVHYQGPPLLYDMRYFIEFMDDGRNYDQSGRNLSSTARQHLFERYHAPLGTVHEGLLDLSSPEQYYAQVSHGRTFVFFYVPWCTHSNDVSVTFTIAAMQFQDDASVTFARVNCIAQRAICAALHIEYFPHFMYYHDGRVLNYDTKDRKLEQFVGYVKRMKSATTADVDKEHQASRENVDTLPGSKTAENAIPLTSKTWQKSVAVGKKVGGNSFVMFYSPYCTHCTETMPVWNALGIKYNKKPSTALIGGAAVRIFKLDCMADMDFCARKLSIDRYPSFIWYDKDGTEIDRFLGERDGVQEFEEFMQQTVGQPAKKPDLEFEKPDSVKIQQMMTNDDINKLPDGGAILGGGASANVRAEL